VARRVSSRRLVGREYQLAELQRLLHDAIAGKARIALIGGESGVGKTRLADELLHHAKAQGVRVLAGDCIELAEGELPYAPLIGALRPLFRAGDPALDAVREEFNRPLGDVDAADQGRVFELLLDALDALAQEAPVVLVLEDIHWADRSTRDFLAFAARRKVTGLFLGPLTNLAKGLLEDTAAFRDWRPTVMAGAFAVEGKAAGGADFNSWSDPEALQRALESGVMPRLVPLDVTRLVEVTGDDLARGAACCVWRWTGCRSTCR